MAAILGWGFLVDAAASRVPHLRRSANLPLCRCALSVEWRSTLNASRGKQLIETACDEEVLKAYEHLAVRAFIFVMAVYGLIRAALR